MSDSTSDGTSTALATIGTVLWCIQLIPQCIRNWYVRDCEGVPVLMMFLWAASGLPFAIYFLVQNSNTALMVQPHLFMFFSLVAFWQCMYYPPARFGIRKALVIMVVFCVAIAGIEAGVTIPLRRLYAKGTTWPDLIPGIIASVLLAVGLLPPYWEMWKRQGRSVGINFVFLFLDSSGAIFSTAAVAVQPGKTDILGLVLYLIVLALEYGIFTTHLIWMIRVRYFGLSVEKPAESDESRFTDSAETASKTDGEKLQQTLDATTPWQDPGEDHSSSSSEMPSYSQPLRTFVTIHIVNPTKTKLRKIKAFALRKDLSVHELSPAPV